MPRKTPIPKREKEICRRFFEFRTRTRLSRVAVAERLGITVSRLSNYEHGAVPLRYHFARRFADLYGLNLEWLVEDRGDPEDAIVIGPGIDAAIHGKMLLSEAFDRFIKPALAEAPASATNTLQEILDQQGSRFVLVPIRSVGLRSYEHTVALIQRVCEAYLKRLPAHLYLPFYKAVSEAARKLVLRHEHGTGLIGCQSGGNTPEPKSGSMKTLVDKEPAGDYPSATDMKTRWRDYQKKLRELCKVRGTKAAIAKKLKVSRTMVAKWVEGSEPSYDLAVQVIEWIDKHWTAKPET